MDSIWNKLQTNDKHQIAFFLKKNSQNPIIFVNHFIMHMVC